MKSLLKLAAVLFAAAFINVSGVAAETASPTGTWTWTQPGRDGNGFEQTLKLNYQDGKLTGTMLGGQRPFGQIPDAEISDATFVDGVVAFTVVREFNGNRFEIKYSGKLDGDTIKGSVERPGRDGGEPVKRDWTAARAK